jgi:cell division protein FtsB
MNLIPPPRAQNSLIKTVYYHDVVSLSDLCKQQKSKISSFEKSNDELKFQIEQLQQDIKSHTISKGKEISSFESRLQSKEKDYLSLEKYKTQLESQIEELKKEHQSLKHQLNEKERELSAHQSKTLKSPAPQNFQTFTPSQDDHSGLFEFLREQNQDQNPHLSKQINVTASSFCGYNFPENVLEWGASNYWTTSLGRCEDEWIDFDLKVRSFIVTDLCFYNYSWYSPNHSNPRNSFVFSASFTP